MDLKFNILPRNTIQTIINNPIAQLINWANSPELIPIAKVQSISIVNGKFDQVKSGIYEIEPISIYRFGIARWYFISSIPNGGDKEPIALININANSIIIIVYQTNLVAGKINLVYL